MCGGGGSAAPVIRRKSSRNIFSSGVFSTSMTTALIGSVVENKTRFFPTRRGSTLPLRTYSAAAFQEVSDCGLQTVRCG